jgi:hypothetical protein
MVVRGGGCCHFGKNRDVEAAEVTFIKSVASAGELSIIGQQRNVFAVLSKALGSVWHAWRRSGNVFRILVDKSKVRRRL